MPALRDLQERFAAAVVTADAGAIAGGIIDDAPGAAARLAIYANHYRITLIDALAATYPVVAMLVGDDFFRAAARRFVMTQPPAQPCLFEYGAGFATYLASLPEAAGVAYLPDVASLEWALHAALHAPEPVDAELNVEEGAAPATSDPRIALHPSCQLVCSDYPVDRIWQVHQVPCDDREPVDLAAGVVRLLVHRTGDDAAFVRLSPADAAFVARLLSNDSLAGAMAAAQAIKASFDPTPLLAALIENALVVSITHQKSSEES